MGDFPPPWASAWGDDFFGLWAELTVNTSIQRMRWIEPSGPEGFLMGSTQRERDAIQSKALRDVADRNESVPRTVIIEQGFWLADTPCTQEFWRAVMSDTDGISKDSPDTAQYPVEQVSWDAVDAFIYLISNTPKLNCKGLIALPTEAQWEYAARAGSTTAYWWGDGTDRGLANWNKELLRTTHVKTFSANPWGLYDVHGNVWERCSDLWQQHLYDPKDTLELEACVVRGGSWHDSFTCARSAFRGKRYRSGNSSGLGFRFALKSSVP